ncbi:DUF7079 family protein [Pseudomonas syringae]|uniref:DUF7079 family protein n=1 Tax=Pseudomonas syringae TaxID=317 RepID=UPI000CD1630C
MKTVDANRLKIWQALSEFFLDTEITDATFDYVARVVLETDFRESPYETSQSFINSTSDQSYSLLTLIKNTFPRNARGQTVIALPSLSRM